MPGAGAPSPRACLLCEIEFDVGPCLSCGGPGVRGRLADFCPHGKRKPFRGWPCPECRDAFVALHRIRPIVLDKVNPGRAY